MPVCNARKTRSLVTRKPPAAVLSVQFASKTCQAVLCHILTCSSGMMSSMNRKVMQQPPLSIRKLLIIGCGLCRFQTLQSGTYRI